MVKLSLSAPTMYSNTLSHGNSSRQLMAKKLSRYALYNLNSTTPRASRPDSATSSRKVLNSTVSQLAKEREQNKPTELQANQKIMDRNIVAKQFTRFGQLTVEI